MRRIEARYPGHISTENVRIHELSTNKHGRQDAYLRPSCGSSSLGTDGNECHLHLPAAHRDQSQSLQTCRRGIKSNAEESLVHCMGGTEPFLKAQELPLLSPLASSSLRWRISLSLDSRVSAGLQSSHAVGPSDDQAVGSWDWTQLKSQSRWLHRGATLPPANIVQPCLIRCRSGRRQVVGRRTNSSTPAKAVAGGCWWQGGYPSLRAICAHLGVSFGTDRNGAACVRCVARGLAGARSTVLYTQHPASGKSYLLWD